MFGAIFKKLIFMLISSRHY